MPDSNAFEELLPGEQLLAMLDELIARMQDRNLASLRSGRLRLTEAGQVVAGERPPTGQTSRGPVIVMLQRFAGACDLEVPRVP